jgi:hypothetical protein
MIMLIKPWNAWIEREREGRGEASHPSQYESRTDGARTLSRHGGTSIGVRGIPMAGYVHMRLVFKPRGDPAVEREKR